MLVLLRTPFITATGNPIDINHATILRHVPDPVLPESTGAQPHQEQEVSTGREGNYTSCSTTLEGPQHLHLTLKEATVTHSVSVRSDQADGDGARAARCQEGPESASGNGTLPAQESDGRVRGSLQFSKLIAMPGGGNKFTVRCVLQGLFWHWL